jgi:tape measure domain-containing protein
MADYTLSAKGTYDGSNFDSGIEGSKSKMDAFMEKAQSIGSKVESFAKGAVSVIGGIGGAIGSLAAQGGMSRALNLEQAQTMFKGLKLEWDDYYKSIDNAVTGTAFSLDSAALVAANLAASGIAAGADMDKALRGVVGTAATFGSELGDIGGIFQKVAAQGKVSGETLQQFADRGVNVTSVLSQALGKTQEEIKDMVSKGQIDFDTFSTAMESAFGDSAQAANETFTGSMSNMQSALNRIGAKFADPIRANAIPVFNSLRKALNAVSGRLDPLVEKFTELADRLSGGLTSKIDTFTAALERGDSIMSALEETFGAIGSKVAIVVGAFAGIGVAAGALSSIAAVVPGLGTLAGILSGGAASAGTFSAALGVLKGAFGLLTSPAGLVIALVLALVGAFAHLMATNEEFRNGIMAQVSAIGGTLMPLLQELMAQFVETANYLGTLLLPVLESIVQAVLPPLLSIIQSLIPVMAAVASAVMEVVAAIAPLVVAIAETLIPIIGQVLEFVASVVAQVVPLVVTAINTISDMVQEYMPLIMEIITMVLTTIQQIFDAVWPSIQELVTTVVAVIANLMQTYWPQIQAVITSAMDVIMAVVNAVWPFIQSVITNVMNIIQNVISVVTAAISGDWEGVWTGVSNLLQSIWDGMGNIVSAGIDMISDFISTVPDKILSFFENAGTLLWDAGSQIIGGLLDGLKAAVGGVWDFVSGIGETIASLKGPKEYDMKLLIPNGGWIMDSLTVGLQLGEKDVIKTISGVAGNIKDAIKQETADIDVSAGVNPWEVDVTYRTVGDDKSASSTSSLLDDLIDEVSELKQSLGDIIADNAPVVVETERQAARRYRRAYA